MKKVFAWVLALCMMLTCAAALADNVAGEWSLIEIRAEGSSMNPALYGMNMVFVFQADGNCEKTTSFGEESIDEFGTWAQNGNAITVNVSGIVNDLTLENGILLMDCGAEGIFVFSQDSAAAAEAELPVAVLADNVNVFQGNWVLSAIYDNGSLAPAEATGTAGTMSIDAEKVLFAYSDMEVESEYYFADGSLQFTVLGEGVSLALTDSGWLALSMEVEGIPSLLYFVPQEAPLN